MKPPTSEGLEVTTITGARTTLSLETLGNFRAGFRGQVIRGGDPAYEEARQIWNAMIDRRPALIVRCTGTADVSQAVRLAAAHGLLVSVKGGGHNIAGLAICEGGLVIDLSAMRGVWVDPGRALARVQAGCTLADVDRETQIHGLATVLGFVSATGVAGLTTGGGFGYLTRRAGWTCDNVLSMDVVTADGVVRRASADENADLFWALRGGSGNFGIVTSFEYRLHPVGPQILGGGIAWHGRDARKVLEFYRQFSASAPRELTTVATVRIAPPAPWLPREVHGLPIVALFVCHTGRLEDAEKVVAPLRTFGEPVADIIAPRPYTQMQSLLDGTQPKGRRYYWKSEYLPAISPELIEAVVREGSRITLPHSAVVLFQIEGALGELPPDHSPAGNRDAAFVVNLAGSWEAAADDAPGKAWVRDAWAAVRPFSTGGAYLNFMTDDEGADRIEAAYGRATLERLALVKEKYDPTNLFRHTKGVLPPAARA